MQELFFSASESEEETQSHGDISHFEGIANAADLTELGCEIRKASRQLGFAHYLYGARIRLADGDKLQCLYSGYPAPWMNRYRAKNYIRIDPVVEHCFYRNSNLPLQWAEELFDTAERRSFWEDAKRHGIVSGLSVPVRGARGEVALFSVANPGYGTDTAAHQLHTAGTLYLLGSYVHEAIRRLVYETERSKSNPPELSPRELECLKWWVAGKSAWDIGQILHVSERTVRFHLDNTKRKFGAKGKTQVVTKAVQLGLAAF